MAGKPYIDIDVDLLKRLYAEGLTTRQIADRTGTSSKTVCRRLSAAGVEMRPQGLPPIPIDIDWLRKQCEAGRTAKDIAKEIGCSSAAIARYIRLNQIPHKVLGHNKGRVFGESVRAKMAAAKAGKYLGESNPNWKGGQVHPDTRLRNGYQSKAWAKAVKDRDGHKCVKCGAAGRLHSHHVKPWKDNHDLRFDVSNGITLCPPCHQKEHGWQFPEWVYHDERRTSAGHLNGEDIV